MIQRPAESEILEDVGCLNIVCREAFWQSIESNPLYKDYMMRKRSINRDLRPANSNKSRKRVKDIIEFMRQREWDLQKKELHKGGQTGRWVSGSEIVKKFWPDRMHRTAIVRILDDLVETRTLERIFRVVNLRRSAYYRLSVFHSQEDPEMIRKQREMEANHIIYLKLDAAEELLKERGCRNPDKAIADKIVDKWVTTTPEGRIPHYARKDVRDRMGKTRSTVVRLPI